jgi:hypothetical protein
MSNDNVIDIDEWAVSDAGPDEVIMVYVRLTGRVVWRSDHADFKDVPHRAALQYAVRLAMEHNLRLIRA